MADEPSGRTTPTFDSNKISNVPRPVAGPKVRPPGAVALKDDSPRPDAIESSTRVAGLDGVGSRTFWLVVLAVYLGALAALLTMGAITYIYFSYKANQIADALTTVGDDLEGTANLIENPEYQQCIADPNTDADDCDRVHERLKDESDE